MIDWVADPSIPISARIDSHLHPADLRANGRDASHHRRLMDDSRPFPFHWRSKTNLVPDGWPTNPAFELADIAGSAVACAAFPITVWAPDAIDRNWWASEPTCDGTLNSKRFPIWKLNPAAMIFSGLCGVDPYCADRPVWPLALERSWSSTNVDCNCRPPDWLPAEWALSCPANPNSNKALRRSVHSGTPTMSWN